ncbi:hypothetical protein MRX96_016135 [Rhipicephalus microplus]
MAARRRLSTTAPPAASTQSWHGTHGSTTPQPAEANPPRPRGPPHARASSLPPSCWTLSLSQNSGSVPSEMQKERTRCHSREVYVSPRAALEVGGSQCSRHVERWKHIGRLRARRIGIPKSALSGSLRRSAETMFQ